MKRLLKKISNNDSKELVNNVLKNIQFETKLISSDKDKWISDPDSGIMNGGVYKNTKYITTYKKTDDCSISNWEKICKYLKTLEAQGKSEVIKFDNEIDIDLTGIKNVDDEFDMSIADITDESYIKILFNDSELQFDCFIEYYFDYEE